MTPEEYRDLFEKHGVEPTFNSYLISDYKGGRFTKTNCRACAVGIRLVEAAGGIEKAFKCRSRGYIAGTLVDLTGLSWMFVDGLDDGWQAERPRRRDNAQYTLGYAEGVAARGYIRSLSPPEGKP